MTDPIGLSVHPFRVYAVTSKIVSFRNMSLVALAVPLFIASTPAIASAETLTCQGESATEVTIADNGDIIGTSNADVIVGTDGPDVIRGFGGGDLICGLQGDDIIYGGVGQDRIYGNAGQDIIYGGNGDDELYGGWGDDELYGQRHSDIIRGGRGDDLLEGSNGSDQIYGGNGNDDFLAGNGNDFLYGQLGNDQLDGGAGSDELRGGAGSDELNGGAGNDVLVGNAGNDLLIGHLGNDRLAGGMGADSCLEGTAAGCEPEIGGTHPTFTVSQQDVFWEMGYVAYGGTNAHLFHNIILPCESNPAAFPDPHAVIGFTNDWGRAQINQATWDHNRNPTSQSFQSITGQPWEQVLNPYWNGYFAAYVEDVQGLNAWTCWRHR